MSIQFPANAYVVYDVMISIATFDFLPTDDIFPSVFRELPELEIPYFKSDEAYERFDRMELGSRFLVMNMGTMLIIFCVYLVLYLVYPCFYFIRNDSKCGGNAQRKL